MNRLNPSNKNYTFQGIDQTDKVYNLADENWKDDTLETGIGDTDGSDPSMKGYNKGYQMDPYQQRFYAKKKEAAKEMIDISHSAENYANEILALWAETDGPLQNFYEGFTMNKVTNKMKKQIAEELSEQGHKVYPVLVDERSRYASISKKLKKLASDDTEKLIEYFTQIFPESVVMELVKNDVVDSKNEGYTMEVPELDGILEYYLQSDPHDYAAKLLNVALASGKATDIQPFQDFQLSDATLTALENVLSGQADPMYNGPWTNEEAQDRSDIGVPPNTYETRISKRLKKKQ